MKLTTKTRYALRALIDLIIHIDEGPVQIKDISERQEISESYLENIFLELRKKNIIKAIKGRNGGFYIERPISDITLFDIIDALNEDISLVPCVENPHICSRADNCPTRPTWVKMKKELEKITSSISLEELINNLQLLDSL